MRVIAAINDYYDSSNNLLVCVIADQQDVQLKNISEEEIIKKYNSFYPNQKIISEVCLVYEPSELYVVAQMERGNEEIYCSFCIPIQNKNQGILSCSKSSEEAFTIEEVNEQYQKDIKNIEEKMTAVINEIIDDNAKKVLQLAAEKKQQPRKQLAQLTNEKSPIKNTFEPNSSAHYGTNDKGKKPKQPISSKTDYWSPSPYCCLFNFCASRKAPPYPEELFEVSEVSL